MMSLLIPGWVWAVLGWYLGWKMRGYFGKKFSFLGFIRNPLKSKKKKKKPPRVIDVEEEELEEEKTVVDKAKSTVNKLAGFLARPIEKFMGNEKDEEEDE